MSEEYRIEAAEQPDWDTIGGGIGEFNAEQAGDDSSEYLCYLLRGPDGETAGGVIAAIHYGWLYVSLMWVREDLRGKGWGARLLAQAEEEAKQRGVASAYLDTFSFQAPGFYEKAGYRILGELADFPAGHKRFYMLKEL
ncbi:MAG: GNAT family N-acetyltransferase [Anaerolineales bacterium]|nr:GNAT family N-acetyltransferase [Anaerolineales bacterium]